jgi:hypothetical protein
MPKIVKRRSAVEPCREGARASEEQSELALLAEFMLHRSVDSLAAAIAARLGADVQYKDLIASADLGPRRSDC